MANEGEADDANSLEYAVAQERETCVGIAFEFLGYVWSFYENRCDDDEHADKRKSRCTREFVNVAVE